MPATLELVKGETSVSPFGGTEWDEAVLEGRELVEKIAAAERSDGEWKLALGALVGRTCPKRVNGGDRKSVLALSTGFQKDLLPVFAKEIGPGTSTLRRYRDVADHWQGQETKGMTWKQLSSGAGITQSGGPSVKNKKPATKPLPPVSEAAKTRALEDSTKYKAMLQAPVGDLNIPLIRRVEKIVEVVGELMALPPEVAVTQLPPERYHQFAFTEFAEWLLDFTKLCEEKRQELTPDVERRPFRPVNDTVNPVILRTETLPVDDERQLNHGERNVLRWLRKQEDTVALEAIGVALRINTETARQRLTRLIVSNLVEVAGKVGKYNHYKVVPK